jgi:hypothetical protein
MAGRRSSGLLSTTKFSTSATTNADTCLPIKFKFYWNRPLGAPTGTFRLTVCLAKVTTTTTTNASAKKKKPYSTTTATTTARTQPPPPLSWSLAYTTVADICAAILASPTVVAVELVGPAQAYEALGATPTDAAWNKIQDALVTVLHRHDNYDSNDSNVIQSLQFASGVMDQQTSSLLASVLASTAGNIKGGRPCVHHQLYSVRIHYDCSRSTTTSSEAAAALSKSTSKSSFLTDTLQQLWVGRDQLHELHLHFEGTGGTSGFGATNHINNQNPYAMNPKDATVLGQILPSLHTVSLIHVTFTCPTAWKLVFCSLEESPRLEQVHLDVSVMNNANTQNTNKNKNNNKQNDSSSAVTTATTTTTTTTTTPHQRATLQAYLDWNVRLNTARRCLLERVDCQVQSTQSKSTSHSFLAYRQRQQRQQQQRHGSDDDVVSETAIMLDSAVVVLTDWWRAAHRPDLPQYNNTNTNNTDGRPADRETETDSSVYRDYHHYHHEQHHAAAATTDAVVIQCNSSVGNKNDTSTDPPVKQ